MPWDPVFTALSMLASCQEFWKSSRLVSRGVSPAELQNLQLWWSGPRFLLNSKEVWLALAEVMQVNSKEEWQAKLVVLNVTTYTNDMLLRFSSLTRVLRVISWCLRFIATVVSKVNCALKHRLSLSLRLPRHSTDSLYLASEELRNFKLLWISTVHGHYFPHDSWWVRLKFCWVQHAIMQSWGLS